MTDPIDIPALKAAALAATPGEWRVENNVGSSTDIMCGETLIGLFGDVTGNPEHEANAAYIALANPAAVLTLIERLETAEQRYRDFEHEVNTGRSAQHERLVARLERAEHRLMLLGYRRTCDIPACNCGDQWAHKLACPIKCSCDKCGLEKLASLLREWRAAKFFDTRERWLSWVEEFGPRVDAALASLEAAP